LPPAAPKIKPPDTTLGSTSTPCAFWITSRDPSTSSYSRASAASASVSIALRSSAGSVVGDGVLLVVEQPASHSGAAAAAAVITTNFRFLISDLAMCRKHPAHEVV